MDKRTKQNYITWICVNLLLPLLPIMIRGLIIFFGDNTKVHLFLLDSSELFYYCLFICVISLNEISQDQRPFTGFLWFYRSLDVMVIIIDVVLIVMMYLGAFRPGESSKIASVVLPLFMAISTAFYMNDKFKNLITDPTNAESTNTEE